MSEDKRLLTFDNFLIRCKKAHGDRFEYDATTYTKTSSKLSILCKKHNCVFQQKGSTHLNYKGGCPKCKSDVISNIFKHTKEEFVYNSVLAHGNKYDYTLVEYEGSKVKVNIICPVHGVFRQKPNDHTAGHGCSS